MSINLIFDDLGKDFGQTRAVNNLTATVRPGVVTAFLGPNGAGKTTTLRMLLGLVSPTRGTATFNGTPYHELTNPIRQVGAMLEATGFHPGRTALDHLRTIAVAARLEPDAPSKALETVGLTEVARRKVGGFSLGMRQRLGLAGALLGDPLALVLDEPANGLDPHGIRWLRTLLRGMAEEGRTVLVSSHLLAEVEQTADDVLLLAHGRLLRHATLAQLRAEYGGSTNVGTPQAADLRRLLSQAGHHVQVLAPDELTVDAPPATVGALAAQYSIVLHRLVESSAGLEQTFMALTEEVPA
jgi:ABC-2 type transport system ATP-binding protein